MTDQSTDSLAIVNEVSKEILEYMGVQASISVSSEQEDAVRVDIDTEDTGLLIGYHGETINSFQRIVGMIVHQKTGDWVRILTNVGDYREKREETVKSLALRAAQEVALTKQPTALPFLVPFERRIVHMALSEHPDVITESEGEGRDRRIVVKPRE